MTQPSIESLPAKIAALLILTGLLIFPRTSSADQDWPHWRGPNGNGIAVSSNPPLKWDESSNIIWKSSIPGRGHSSPAVVGKRIFLTTADEKKKEQFALCYSRENGKLLWNRKLYEGGWDSPSMAGRSWANSSPACDGERVYLVFSHKGKLIVSALDLEGKEAWKKTVGDFVSHHGYSASPVIYGSTLVISADHKKGGYLAALDRKTGDLRWKTMRPPEPSYVAPAILTVAGRKQLVISGCNLFASYDPGTGKELWASKTTTTECVGTVVASGDLVFASGGYPKNLTVCVNARNPEKVVWKKPIRTYVPCMLTFEGHLYTVTDRGIGYCWEVSTGEEKWKARIGKSFIASPIISGGRIYASSDKGTTHVFSASPEGCKRLATNPLGTEIYATPSICGDRIYLRSASRAGGKRAETLYCIGNTSLKN